MEKLMVTHRLSLDMSNQAVQATITLAQYDTATHRLIVSLRNGAEVVELPPGSYAVAVQNPDAGVDVLDSVTVYGPDSVYPNCIVYDVGLAVTAKEGYHESLFLITYMDENDTLRQLSSPRIAFVIKPDIMCASDIKSSSAYTAIINAEINTNKAAEAAESSATAASGHAESAKSSAAAASGYAESAGSSANTASEAADSVKRVGVVTAVAITSDEKLSFTFFDGRTITTNETVKGAPGKDADEESVINAVTRNLEAYIEKEFLKGEW